MHEMEVRQLVTYASSVGYHGDFWTAERIDIWCEELLDLDFATAERALREWVRGQAKPPTIADIRNAVNELHRQAREETPRIEEPPLSNEQRAENIRRIREMTAQIASVPDE